ncbi:tetraacyldisaccharide 4'-kinase [Psychromonas sp. MME2]
MLFKRLGIPIVVDPIRTQAVDHLYQHCSVDIVISDDGLQHYALQRDIEIVVVDGQRRMGNGHLMPMGPLREPLSRLQTVDFVINNGGQSETEVAMLFQPRDCVRVDGQGGELHPPTLINSCAAIGYPQRFFTTLEKLHYKLHKTVSFADHYAYGKDDFKQFDSKRPLVMTEKDAVKCLAFAQPNWWYLPIEAVLPDSFAVQLLDKIKEIKC